MIHKSNLRHIVNDYNIIDDAYAKSNILANIGLKADKFDLEVFYK